MKENLFTKSGFVESKFKNIFVPLILSFSLALSGYFIGNGIFRSMTKRTVTVKGLAEKDVKADLAVWNIHISKVGSSLLSIQKDLNLDISKVKKFLVSQGFKDNELQDLRIQVKDRSTDYLSRDEMKSLENKRYVVETGVLIRTPNVDLVDSVSRKLGDLVSQGIAITNDYSGPVYIFNGLNDIKTEMIEQATKNATVSGKQFAKDANTSLGDIYMANQGVFSIEARDPIDNWTNERQAIEKKVRVVSTITFYLK